MTMRCRGIFERGSIWRGRAKMTIIIIIAAMFKTRTTTYGDILMLQLPKPRPPQR